MLINYELKIRLSNLTLTAIDGKLNWIGTNEQNDRVETLLANYEKHER